MHAWAFNVDSGWSGIVCQYLPCTAMGGGATGLSDYLVAKVVTGMEIAFVALALGALFLSAMNMVIFGEQEDVVKQSRTQFIYAISACGVVSFARWIAEAFAPQYTGADLVNHVYVETMVGNVIALFKISLVLLISVNLVIQGMRLITSQGEQDQFQKASKRLIGTFVGAAFVLLANTLVQALLPGASGSGIVANEFAGVANYIITAIGFGAVVVIIVGGGFLVLSVNDGLKDKAKTMVKTAVVALVAVLVSYALVNTFITFHP